MPSQFPDALQQLGLKFEAVAARHRIGSYGNKPCIGQTVSIRYTGRLQDASGAVFDSSEGKPPLTVRVGRGQVISGWDAALPHIAVGETVELIIPPALAYGSKAKPGIPPNSTLFFEIELLAIEADSPGDQLLDAASTGDAVAVARLLRSGANVNHADRKGATALHLAAAGGRLECLVRLLEAGAEVDAVQSTPAGVTPLMHAVKSSAEPMCARLLLHATADPNKQSAKGNTAQGLMEKDGDYKEVFSSGELYKPRTPHKISEYDLGVGTSKLESAQWERLRTRALFLEHARNDNPRCFLTFEVDGAVLPPVEIELFADVVPKTAENFRCLCTGEKGRCSAFGAPPLHLKGNVMHRIVPGNILQGGDITSGDGKGGESIYGRKFEDESFMKRAGKHSSKGLLSMANSGRNSNGSQFFITLDALPHLDGKHVVFGKVLKGMECVEAIVGVAGTASGVPAKRVVVADCGVLPAGPAHGGACVMLQ